MTTVINTIKVPNLPHIQQKDPKLGEALQAIETYLNNLAKMNNFTKEVNTQSGG